MKRLITLLSLLLLAPSIYAAPAPSGYSGTPDHGQPITINGAGFGTKTTAAPDLWDTVENQYTGLSDGQTIPDGSGHPWEDNANTNDYVKYESSVSQRSPGTAMYQTTGAVYNTLYGHRVSATTKFYVSWWFRSNGDISNGGLNQNNKLLRLSGATNANTFSWNANHAYVYRDSEGYCTSSGISATDYYDDGDITANTWHRLEVAIDSSARTYEMFLDGASYSGLESWATCGAFNFDYVWVIGYDAQGGTRTSQWDDIYIDNSWARVEVCSGSTWASRGHCEPQIPSAWSASSISATVNRGSFGTTDSAYLYVVDSTGAVNSSGLAITFGDTGSTITCYPDVDGDLYPGSGSESVETCSTNYYESSHFTAMTADCDDTDADINPGETDICGNSIDEDCSGSDATCPPSSGHQLIQSGSAKLRSGAGTFYTRATPEEDTTPSAFSFTDQTGAALSSTITSAAITVEGINAATAISVTGGTYDINASGTFVSSSSSVSLGDTVRARHTSSSSNSTATNTAVTIGGVSDTFTSTTLAGGGGTLLVGDNTITAVAGDIDGNQLYVLNDPSGWEVATQAVATGYAVKGHFLAQHDLGNNCKMVIASSSGVIIEASTTADVSDNSTLAEEEVTFAGTTPVGNGTGYYPGVICDGVTKIGQSGIGWEGAYAGSNSYTTPANFDPGSLSGSGLLGRPKLWITN